MTGAEDNNPDNAMDDLTRSVKMLLLLSRTEFSDEEKEEVAAEAESLSSWKLFASLAVRHGVAALVWQNMMDLGLDSKVPDTERALLEGLRFRSIARVSWIAGAAAEITRMLEGEGIRTVLLKGLALEHTVYGSRGLRQMSDADLLVAPSEALRARDLLIRNGFETMPMKSPLYRHIILDLGNHLPELHRGGISVDLHYRLFGPEGNEIVARAIDESEIITSGEGTFRVLPPATAFLALVSHIYKHEIKGEFQLRLWVDIYLLLKRYGGSILTASISSAAREAGIEPESRIVLTVMEQVWGLEIPEEMRAQTPDENRKAGRFMHDLMHPGAVEALSQREMFHRNMASLKSFRKKAIFILGDIFPSVGFMKKRYGCRTAAGAVFRYPHRLGKIAWFLGLPGARSGEI